jgi:hypothetical protein
MTAGPKPHIRAVSATAPTKKRNGSLSPATGRKFAASAISTKNSAMPYRSAGFSRYKSRPASRWRSPSMCDYSSVTRTAGRVEERTLPLINTNNMGEHQRQTSHTGEGKLGGTKTEGVSENTIVYARIRRIFFSLPARTQVLACCFLRSFDNARAVREYEDCCLLLSWMAVRWKPNRACLPL